MSAKTREGAGHAPLPGRRFNTQIEHKIPEPEPQAPIDEPDRRSRDWAVTAMLGALRALTGDRYIRTFPLHSAGDRELEAVREQLRGAITRRKRNLRLRIRP